MANVRGLALPIRPGSDGRAVMTDDDENGEQLHKVIAIGLSDCSSGNPFQALGVSRDLIFDINDARTEGRASEYIQNLFTRLERQGRARLRSIDVIEERKVEGKLVIEIVYTDLRTRNVKSVRFGLGSAGVAKILEGD